MEVQIKTKMRYQYIPIRMTKIKNIDYFTHWLGGLGGTGTLNPFDRIIQICWKTIWQFLKNTLSKYL